MRFHTYKEAEAWALGRKSILVYFEPFAQAMNEVGNPQNELRCIHVGGTNGKGSTSRFLYSALSSNGKRVGLYTSPHLEHFRDRIRINDVWIPEEVFLSYANQWHGVIEHHGLGLIGICTMFAFLWFREEQVDVAVVEVSMGGRYDTTNVITQPLCSVIASIGMDHMEYLGNTLGEIAGEKAGILKPGCPAVIGTMKEEARQVIVEEAEKIGASLHELGAFEEGNGHHFHYDNEEYEVTLSAPYYKYDAAIALCVLDLLGMDIHSASLKQAIASSVWPGRFETVAEQPRILLDGAHNPDGMNALKDACRDVSHPLIGVFSALKDKQGPAMREIMESFCDEVITTSFENRRADVTSHLGGERIVEDWKTALKEAIQLAGKNGTVVVTGSLYLISIIRSYVKGEKST
ncbi:MAG: bifunctional folylpolyglutamate synthase/dihydrofolate synthase [Solobacterium sp.]|nr:bifunctional folylpolyglutamate synthase/dihydrofolate synthase [Solobacterium sp.]